MDANGEYAIDMVRVLDRLTHSDRPLRPGLHLSASRTEVGSLQNQLWEGLGD